MERARRSRAGQGGAGRGRVGQGKDRTEYLVPNQVGVWPAGVRHGVVGQAGVARLEGAELGHVEGLAELPEGGHVPRQVVWPVEIERGGGGVAQYGEFFKGAHF